MRLVNYKMTLQYEGTRYRGWQKQPGVENTIQGKLETLLTRLMNTGIEVYGAGRTDAGVHALGQVASFRVPEESLRFLAEAPPEPVRQHFRLDPLRSGSVSSGAGFSFDGSAFAGASGMPSGTGSFIEGASGMPPGTGSFVEGAPGMLSGAGQGGELSSRRKEKEDAVLFAALNHYLPDDIAVVRLVRASDRFHARYLTCARWYQYRITTNPVSDVVNRRFLWQYGRSLDTGRMREGAGLLAGRHDFASFCGLKMKKSTVRTISKIEIEQPDEDTILLNYYGDGFLNHMVRLMTGELVEAGAGRLRPEEIGGILAECRKGAACHMAPASGLTLMQVRY